MATATPQSQVAALEKAFGAKGLKCDAAVVSRAQQLLQQLHMSVEAFVSEYETFAEVKEWSMEVTAQRLKAVADDLEKEQRKENSRPRAVGAGAIKTQPLASRLNWDDPSLPDKLDYPTPAAKRQALDPAATNPSAGPKPTPGSAAPRGGAATPVAAAAKPSQPVTWSATPRTALGTPQGGPPSAFAQRTNRGQSVAVLNEHLPTALPGSRGGVRVRALGQPQLSASSHLFMNEVLENKVHALDERIMDFAEALTSVTQHLARSAPAAPPAAAANCTPGGAAAGTPAPAAATPGAGVGTPLGVGPAGAPGGAPAGTPLTPQPAEQGGAEAGSAASDAEARVARPLLTSVAEICPQPVWVAGRIVAEAEGAALNSESLILEGCREASGGARVRLDVSGVPAFRLFPGQSVCVYGLNPTGHTFMAQRVVTHLLPPPPAAGADGPAGLGEAEREGGLSLVVAVGPYTLSDDLAYSPLDELLAHCSAHPPDVLLLLGPFVDAEHPAVAKGTCDVPLEAIFTEQVAGKLSAWRAAHPATTLALMPAVRDVAAAALPVLPQPPLALAGAGVGPADKVVSLQNPSTAAVGPLVLGACSADVLRALAPADLARQPPGQQAAAGERLPALAGHVLGQRSYFPLYPAPPGSCLDTSHYSQLQLPVCPDLLLAPSDLAPFARVLQPAAWAPGAAPGLVEAGAAGGAGAGSAVGGVVVVNPGRLSRGGSGGTFAQVVVVPGSGPLAERTRVEVKRV